jgi:hypothetical protein
VEAADPRTLSPACFLRPDVDALTSALDAPKEWFPCADVVPALLGAVAQASGNRNLLLLEHRTAGTDLPELDAAAVAIHAVALTAPGDSPGILAEVPEQTGGMRLATREPDRIPELCGKLYFGLLHPNAILHHPDAPGPAGPRRLQVYAEQGCGEDVLCG